MPTVFPPPPLLKRIQFLLNLLWMHNFVRFYLFVRRLYRVGYYKDAPTFTLTVPQHKLPSYWVPSTAEVYLPKSYPTSTSSSTILAPTNRFPLFFTIHGGGFNVGHPVLDSEFNRYISDAASCIVVALAYRKTPYSRWPVQVQDLTALVVELLKDERISHIYDPSKVAVGGFSAGGNLSTALSIQPELKGKIQTIVPVYPVLDFTMTTQEKLGLRPKDAPPDVLRNMGDFFSFGYVPRGTDRENPSLSPLFAKAEDLPENIYLVGCEYDMLNIDSRKFYEKFGKVKKNLVFDEVKGVRHGFTHQSVERMDSKANERLSKITFELYDRIAVWLTDLWTEKKVIYVPFEETGNGELEDDIVIL
ncbi:hypothetical protein TWF569_007418 [Orbilia oligospora]|uniref:Alpha/beta hydrolase fold-3 domain-containing protein n=1 Tax=Orbilia oligospora TaxID=2813651 RepID=A0A7C8J263_ORBOL|nr:hypothetical protein TWF706_003143 [Orbilia oligospora]KAF3083710.1 hypothetical protein TWF102_000586 [Orbilia oligospora]KAF3084637.1 hypothetical protein TWF103_002351 [Orbilia oligospora]KAF3125179.1 hypothetical protein TWF703_011037 [Orbilia oligospora]KAF3135653.1 hypothetical protein TWF594_008374 [Orbilia oligospora]